MCGETAVYSHAEPFPFAHKPWSENAKEIMKRIWGNDPTFIEAM